MATIQGLPGLNTIQTSDDAVHLLPVLSVLRVPRQTLSMNAQVSEMMLVWENKLRCGGVDSLQAHMSKSSGEHGPEQCLYWR